MPNREIKESCRSSPTLLKLSDFAERLFWRLVTVADDFGRFPADPRFIKSECFPLFDLKTGRVEKAYTELLACRLVTAYADSDRTYGFFTTWDKHQRTRAKHSKYPAPSSDNICQHMPSNVADLRSSNRSDLREDPSSDISAADAAAPPPCPDCLKVLTRLNQCQGRNGNGLWRVGKNGTYPGLHDRHKETSVEACLQVVNVAGKRLWDDPKTRPFSRPSTLFGPRNFTEKYLPEAYAAAEEENAH